MAEHGQHVGDVAADIAAEIGAPTEWVEQIRLAARLHDIGIISIAEALVAKPGPLTALEYDDMRSHAALGAEILSGSSSPLFQLATEIALSHHERWDGTGYPVGLDGARIPLSGRIVAIADAFDTMVGERAYKESVPVAEALRQIAGATGRQFDPRLVDAFVTLMLRRDPSLAAEFGRSVPE
jgi:putative two-component system response regulator